jgi:ABC-type antimicrobial peptide transport system permease subunit
MAAGLVERRRPFALLRASGLRPGELRRMVLLETAVSMLLTAGAGVVLGMGASYALARLGDLGWAWPDAGALGLVGVAVGAALALSAVVLPLVDVATRYDAVRFE